MRRFTFAAAAVGAVVISAVVAWGAVKQSSQSKGGGAVAFAKADIGEFTLKCFGGKGTTSAQISGGDPNLGVIELTFTGKYPKDITKDVVVAIATSQSGSTFGVVADAYVFQASPTEIVVGVEAWKSDTLEAVAGPVFLTVYVGQTPF